MIRISKKERKKSLPLPIQSRIPEIPEFFANGETSIDHERASDRTRTERSVSPDVPAVETSFSRCLSIRLPLRTRPRIRGSVHGREQPRSMARQRSPFEEETGISKRQRSGEQRRERERERDLSPVWQMKIYQWQSRWQPKSECGSVLISMRKLCYLFEHVQLCMRNMLTVFKGAERAA